VKLAVLGGSFNPPHIGHLALADEAVLSLGYDRVLFVPARVRPLKDISPGADDKDRIAMTALAIESNRAFGLETCEMEREGPSFTWDTLLFLAQKYPLEGKIGFILGDDLIESFPRWRNYRDIPRAADLILARRTAEPVEVPFPHIPLGNPLVPISSSDIRERIRAGRAWRYLAGERVSEYIIREKLYGYGAI
jgi:nicotinate-nucleotide adenylyltransferase